MIIGLVALIPALRRLTPAGTLSARPVLPAAVLLRGVLTFMFFGVDAYVSLTLEEYRGLSAFAAGHRPHGRHDLVDGRLLDPGTQRRALGDRPVRPGRVRRSPSSGWRRSRSILIPEVPVAWAVPTFAIAGLGMGLAYAPLSLIVLREAAPEIQGSASSALSLSDTLGTALGTGVSGAIVAAGLRSAGDLRARSRGRRSRWRSSSGSAGSP